MNPLALNIGMSLGTSMGVAAGAAGTFNFDNAATAFDPRITFTRSTVGNRFNSSGVLTSTAIDVARANANQDYNPSTLAARGFLIEAGATNGIRNNTMAGASAPATFPTEWVTVVPAEITQTVVGTGTEDGIEYIDVRVNGTTTANRNYVVFPDGLTGSAASNGQTWTASCYARLMAGSFANVSLTQLNARALDGGGGALATFATNSSFAPTSAALRTQRFVASGTIASASTATVRADMFFQAASGTTVDFTIRLGLPQLEQNAFATSVIKTSTAATPRGADLPRVATLSSIGYNSTQGSISGQVMFEGVGSSNTRRIASFNDGTTNNEIAIVMADGGSDLIRFLVTSGGVTQADISSTVAAVANTTYKWAISWNANSFRISVNSTAGTEVTSGTVPTVDRLTIGTDGAGANSVNGWEPTITYYPVQLSQAQMNSITA